MENFRKEVKDLSTRDLMLILEDQLELYSPEEVAVLKAELASRPENAVQLEDEAWLISEQKQMEEAERQAATRHEKQMKEAVARREERRKAALEAREEQLRGKGYAGYYQYRAISLFDGDGGMLSVERVTDMLNDLALDGWRLVTAYANELGHNSSNSGFGPFSTITNETMDQHVLIMERYIKL